MDVGIPTPRVPGPVVSAPPEAKNWSRHVPPVTPVEVKEPPYAVILDNAGRLPKPVSNGFWDIVKRVNRVAFPSPAPNGPVAAEEGSWKFTAIGDYGSGRAPLTDVTNNIARGNPELIVTLGDNVYYDGTEQNFRDKWDPGKFFGDIRRNFPVLPALGNHDVRKEPKAEPYFRRFPELDNARYYSFENKGVHFVSLNTNESLEPGSPQYNWLDQDLASHKNDWNVLYFHHPLNSGFPGFKGKNKDFLAPLIAKHGVDLILSGHEHSYQRSKPLNDIGTLEIVSGGGGQSLHPFYAPMQPHAAYRDVDFGHVEVEVRKDQLVGRYVVRDGSVRDTFQIKNLTPFRPSEPTAGGDAAAQGHAELAAVPGATEAAPASA